MFPEEQEQERGRAARGSCELEASLHPRPSYRCDVRAAHPPAPNVTNLRTVCMYVAQINTALLQTTLTVGWLPQGTDTKQIPLPILAFTIKYNERSVEEVHLCVRFLFQKTFCNVKLNRYFKNIGDETGK